MTWHAWRLLCRPSPPLLTKGSRRPSHRPHRAWCSGGLCCGICCGAGTEGFWGSWVGWVLLLGLVCGRRSGGPPACSHAPALLCPLLYFMLVCHTHMTGWQPSTSSSSSSTQPTAQASSSSSTGATSSRLAGTSSSSSLVLLLLAVCLGPLLLHSRAHTLPPAAAMCR